MSLPLLPKSDSFCDLNIPITLNDNDRYDVLEVKSLILRALQLGYRTIAINVTITQDELNESRAKTKSSQDFPSPPELPKITVDDLKMLGINLSEKKKVIILKRITLAFNDNNILTYCNKSKTLSEFDIVAIAPPSAQALLNLLKTNFRADIVAFNPGEMDIHWNRKLYRECVEKHLYFELLYTPMIRDATARRRTITVGHTYHRFGRSRHLFFSSGAENVTELRAPHDVSNLGFLLGLNEHQSLLAVGKLGQEVVKAAAGKKIGPYRVVIEDLSTPTTNTKQQDEEQESKRQKLEIYN